MPACPACGRENRAEARFCDACGARLEPAALREVRKVVTIVFCDVTGSTAMGERLDSESLRRVMERYFAVARESLERHGGTVEKFIGDAVMAVFGVPVVHEDDALRAARAACELRERLGALNDELRADFGIELATRTGINTGEVVTSEAGTLATGDAVNVAARLEQAAQPGEILVGDATLTLAEGALEVEPVGPIAAKGKSEAVAAHRLLHVRADAPAFARRFDALFVGRRAELGQLEQAYERAARDRGCHLFTVLGAAGVGKSRLTYEFLDGAGESVVLRGRCLAYGEGITYFPLVEILEAIAGDTAVAAAVNADPDAQRIINKVSSAVGLADEPALSREETFHAVRQLFETIARDRPLIVVFDDIHWAEPTFLDLIDHVVDWSRGAPIFILCLARPELLDRRPSWGGGKYNATTALLEPLSADDADALADNLLGGRELGPDLRQRIMETAEGNPLFVEQMLALIADDGVRGGLEVPPTIQALLATRLEQLPTVERVAAERAAVVGKEFWRTALVELGGDAGALLPLVRKELIRPHRSLLFPAEDAFRFRHLLIRDAAYDGMPKELRAELHERFARWLELNRSEYDEIVGYHFEQAYRLREQLGPLDEHARALARLAAEPLGRAGQRAHERGDLPAAIKLLSRATDLLPADERMRGEWLLSLGFALREAGELERSLAVFGEALERASAAGATAVAARARIGARWTAAQVGGAEADFRPVADELEVLERLGDDHGLAEGYAVLAAFQGWVGRSEVAAAAFERSREHARRAGSRRLASQSLSFQVMLEAWGYFPADEGVKRCDALLSQQLGSPADAFVRASRANYLSLLGDAEAAHVELEHAVGIWREFGYALQAAGASMSRADQQLRAGRPEDAEASTRIGVEELEALGETGYLSTMAGLLAQALYVQGRPDEAGEWVAKVRELAAQDDFEPQVRWRRLEARLLADAGRFAEAEALAREAVAVAAGTDWHRFHADALVDLAAVLEAAGSGGEAAALLRRALELYERKCARIEADRVRRRLDELRQS